MPATLQHFLAGQIANAERAIAEELAKVSPDPGRLARLRSYQKALRDDGCSWTTLLRSADLSQAAVHQAVHT